MVVPIHDNRPTLQWLSQFVQKEGIASKRQYFEWLKNNPDKKIEYNMPSTPWHPTSCHKDEWHLLTTPRMNTFFGTGGKFFGTEGNKNRPTLQWLSQFVQKEGIASSRQYFEWLENNPEKKIEYNMPRKPWDVKCYKDEWNLLTTPRMNTFFGTGGNKNRNYSTPDEKRSTLVDIPTADSASMDVLDVETLLRHIDADALNEELLLDVDAVNQKLLQDQIGDGSIGDGSKLLLDFKCIVGGKEYKESTESRFGMSSERSSPSVRSSPLSSKKLSKPRQHKTRLTEVTEAQMLTINKAFNDHTNTGISIISTNNNQQDDQASLAETVDEYLVDFYRPLTEKEEETWRKEKEKANAFAFYKTRRVAEEKKSKDEENEIVLSQSTILTFENHDELPTNHEYRLEKQVRERFSLQDNEGERKHWLEIRRQDNEEENKEEENKEENERNNKRKRDEHIAAAFSQHINVQTTINYSERECKRKKLAKEEKSKKEFENMMDTWFPRM